MKSIKLLALLLVLLALPLAQAQTIKSGDDVLRAMHDRYAKTWYDTLTFEQKSTTYNPDGTNKVDTWHEALQLPAKLRIDVGDPARGVGFLLVDNKVTTFQDNKQNGEPRKLVNMLLVLGFDVYKQSPDVTIAVVKGEGYDLSKVHEETWHDKQVWVVGADKGDLKAKQFWVDEKNLLFVRLFEPSQADAAKINEVRFADYRDEKGGWVAALVEVYSSGTMTFSEEYSEIQINPKLAAGTFDPAQFSTTHWEKP